MGYENNNSVTPSIQTHFNLGSNTQPAIQAKVLQHDDY